MSRTISQKTFDDAVKENIEEFSMTNDEAVKDAIKQFETQGVSLQNIITNSLKTNEVDILTKKIENLKKIVLENPSDPELISVLSDIKEECDDGIAKRVLAGECGLHSTLTNFLINNELMDETFKVGVLEVLIALMTGYPDLLDDNGFKIIENMLKDATSEILVILTLKWSVECCIKHELNRTKFLNSDCLMNSMKNLMEKETISPDILRVMCKLFQTFVLNDDIRAEIPLAHKHACQISNNFLSSLVKCLKVFKNDKKVLVAVLQALSAIIVRNEYCQYFVDAEGLVLLRDIWIENLDDETLCRNCFNLIKIIAGNDEVKAKVMEVIDVSIIVSTLQKFLNSAKTCSQGFGALSMLTLRNNNNCKLLREKNIDELIVQSIKIHATAKKLLKNICWLIKNLAQGNEKFISDLLTLGIEEILRDVLTKHQDCTFEINMALRLLGCEVTSQEIWTGEGRGICN
ncbi:hypothetical protein PGB90_008244 [Kerria lacca]